MSQDQFQDLLGTNSAEAQEDKEDKEEDKEAEEPKVSSNKVASNDFLDLSLLQDEFTASPLL